MGHFGFQCAEQLFEMLVIWRDMAHWTVLKLLNDGPPPCSSDSVELKPLFFSFFGSRPFSNHIKSFHMETAGVKGQSTHPSPSYVLQLPGRINIYTVTEAPKWPRNCPSNTKHFNNVGDALESLWLGTESGQYLPNSQRMYFWLKTNSFAEKHHRHATYW